MESRLCPRCGAYWDCGCLLEGLALPVDVRCEHDWTEAVGVDLEVDLAGPGAHVVVCRLCGLYSVSLAR